MRVHAQGGKGSRLLRGLCARVISSDKCGLPAEGSSQVRMPPFTPCVVCADGSCVRHPQALFAGFVEANATCMSRYKESGATATLAVSVGWELLVASVGDSLAYLDTGSEIVQVRGGGYHHPACRGLAGLPGHWLRDCAGEGGGYHHLACRLGAAGGQRRGLAGLPGH